MRHRTTIVSRAATSSFLGLVMILSSAMICSFLGSKFQTRVAFLSPRIIQQMCSVKKSKKLVNFSSKNIRDFSGSFQFQQRTYLFRGNSLVKLPKILPQKSIKTGNDRVTGPPQRQKQQEAKFFWSPEAKFRSGNVKNRPSGQKSSQIVV